MSRLDMEDAVVREIELPQFGAQLAYAGEPRLLVLGGRAPERNWLWAAARGMDVWAVDAGLDACRVAGLVPSRVVGDFDSASAEGRSWALENGIPVSRYPADKDDTDFQLALELSGNNSAVFVTGCWGGRFDHAFSNVFSAAGAARRGMRVVCLADEREALLPVFGPAELRLSFRSEVLALSLMALMERAVGVTADGVKWPLSGAEILQSRPREISNVPLGGSVTVSVLEGALGVYAAF